MQKLIAILIALVLISAGCASKPQASPAPPNKTPDGNGTAMRTGDAGDTIVLGNGTMGSCSTTDENKVSKGGSIGMQKNESGAPSGSEGGQIVDVGGSIPIR